MVLTIDVGNTTTAIGLYSEDGRLSFLSSLDTTLHKSRDHCAIDLLGVFQLHGANIKDVTGAMISCVVPPAEASLSAAVELLIGKRALIVGPGIKTGLNIRSDLHNQLGSDIVASCVSAMAKYPSPVVVIDLGTATTFSLLRDGVYDGCAILPGVRLGLEALSTKAAALPHISIEPPPSPLGRNTIDAMRSGIVYGSAGMIDSMVERFEQACGEQAKTIVATGGNAPLILPHCKRSILHDPTLLQDGLYRLYLKNTEKHRKA